MGRTIHYSVEDNQENFITEEQWKEIEKLQEKYNSSYNWSCEKLSLERFSIHPNWRAWDETGLKVQQVWKRIEDELKKPDGLKELLDNGLIEVEKGGYRGSAFLMSGFTKVREDEYNAGLVIMFLLEASLIAPGIKLRVQDEGDYLRCPVIIQNGTMKPDKEELKSEIEYWEEKFEQASNDEMQYWAELIGEAKLWLDNSDFVFDTKKLLLEKKIGN
jgi:hypothetical protein